MSKSCFACSSGSKPHCEPRYIYVIQDMRSGQVKIGMTKHTSRRLAQHRKKFPDIHMWHKVEAGCEFIAGQREAAALLSLGQIAQRVVGDWFDCSADLAVRCVNQIMETAL